MRRTQVMGSAIALTLAALAAPVHSQWIPNGVSLSGGISGNINRIVSDGARGAYVAWRRGTNSDDVYLQRVTAAGVIPPGWPVAGLPIASSPESEQIQDLKPDGHGNALVLWYRIFYEPPDPAPSRDMMVQRVGPEGTPAPGWPASGVRLVAPGTQGFGKLAPDGAGGAYVVWEDSRDYASNRYDIYAARLLADGTLAPGWNASGLPLSGGPSTSGLPEAVPDGSGGAYFVWYDNRLDASASDVFGVRVLEDGTVAPGWTPNGTLLSPWNLRGACADGAGGLYVLSADIDLFYLSNTVLYLHRFGPDGAPAPGWSMDGVVACAGPGFREAPRIGPDGRGGVFVVWDEVVSRNGIHATRILPDGSRAAGWVENGTLVSDPLVPRWTTPDVPVDDGMGGAYLPWDADGWAMLQHLSATGQPAPGWPPFGVRVTNTNSQFNPRVASDGEGGAIITWNERCCGRNDIWAQRYVPTGIVAAHLALTSALAEPGRVRLEWLAAGGAGLVARLERRGESGAWRALATLSADGSGRLLYEDRDISPGARLAYRLAWREGEVERVTEAAWVEVPAALELALEGFRPNPAAGAPLVAFTLPRSAHGALELYDLAGRRIASRDLASLPAGRHALRLGEGTPLPPGAYVMRLTHGERMLIARGVVVR